MYTTCQNCEKFFPRFPRECIEWNLVCRGLAPASIRSRALQTEVELQIQCSQLENLKSTNSSLQKDLVELRQELDNYYNKINEARKDVLGKWSAECDGLRDILKAAAAARNAEHEQS